MRRTASTSTDCLLPLLVLLAAPACSTATPPPRPSGPEAAREIEAMLTASADAWTRGDLDGFLDDYADDATFVGSDGLLRGADRIRSLYTEGYWADGRPRDALRFELIDVRVTGPASAVAVGRYLLQARDTGRTTATGLFSLTLERRGERWRIVHDHSSASGG